MLKISIRKNYQNFNKLNAQILNPSVFFFSSVTVSKERRWQDQKFTITLGFRVCFFPGMLFVHVCLFYICWHFLPKNLINLATLSFIPPLDFSSLFLQKNEVWKTKVRSRVSMWLPVGRKNAKIQLIGFKIEKL